MTFNLNIMLQYKTVCHTYSDLEDTVIIIKNHYNIMVNVL